MTEFKDLTVYVCKTCGRAIASNVPPTYCYFDRMTSLENISREDAVKMGLFPKKTGAIIQFGEDDNTVLIVEFSKDFRWLPTNGDRVGIAMKEPGKSLIDFQNEIMGKVIGGQHL